MAEGRVRQRFRALELQAKQLADCVQEGGGTSSWNAVKDKWMRRKQVGRTCVAEHVISVGSFVPTALIAQ